MRISVSCRASVRQPLMCQHPIAQGMIWIEKNTVLKSGPRFRQRWHHQTVGAYPTVTIGQMRPVWHRGSPAHGLCQAGSHTLRDLS